MGALPSPSHPLTSLLAVHSCLLCGFGRSVTLDSLALSHLPLYFPSFAPHDFLSVPTCFLFSCLFTPYFCLLLWPSKTFSHFYQERNDHTKSNKSGNIQKRWKSKKLSPRHYPVNSDFLLMWLCWSRREVVAHAHIEISLLDVHDCWIMFISIVEGTWLRLKSPPPPSSAIRNIVK